MGKKYLSLEINKEKKKWEIRCNCSSCRKQMKNLESNRKIGAFTEKKIFDLCLNLRDFFSPEWKYFRLWKIYFRTNDGGRLFCARVKFQVIFRQPVWIMVFPRPSHVRLINSQKQVFHMVPVLSYHFSLSLDRFMDVHETRSVYF